MAHRLPRRAIALGLGLALAIAIPAAALADTGGGGGIPPYSSNGATITLSNVHMVGKIVVNVTVDFTCNPLATIDPNTWQPTTTTTGYIWNLDATVLQAQGKTIVGGQGFGGYNAPVVCDGSTVNEFGLAITASSLPWKTGNAVAGAEVTLTDNPFNPYGFDSAGTGALVVKLTTK